MIAFKLFGAKPKKPEPNAELLRAFVARTAAGPDRRPILDVRAMWGMAEALEQKAIIHTPSGPVLGGEKELKAKAGKMQKEVMALIVRDMKLAELLAFVRNRTSADDAAALAARLDQIEAAIESICRCELPDLEEA